MYVIIFLHNFNMKKKMKRNLSFFTTAIYLYNINQFIYRETILFQWKQYMYVKSYNSTKYCKYDTNQIIYICYKNASGKKLYFYMYNQYDTKIRVNFYQLQNPLSLTWLSNKDILYYNVPNIYSLQTLNKLLKHLNI